MRRIFGTIAVLSLAVGSVVGIGCSHGTPEALGSSRAASSLLPAYYEVFTPGDATTDQRAGAPGSKSYLVGTYEDDADVVDDDFAAHVAAPALNAGARLFYVLNQCYGGGFLDDVAPLGGIQSILTAARHTETASYASEPPDGTDVDSTDSFLLALGNGTASAQRIAADSVALNPFGPNPNVHRTTEPEGSEHAQYFASGGGAEMRIADFAATGMAVLWAGQPAERDGLQMNRMIDQLVTMGFGRDRIWLLYAGGQADGNHPVVKNHMLGRTSAVNLRAATRKQLVDLFSKTFAPGAANTPNFVFFYVGDHGGLNGEPVAKTRFLRPDSHVVPNIVATPTAVPLYGAGNADL